MPPERPSPAGTACRHRGERGLERHQVHQLHLLQERPREFGRQGGNVTIHFCFVIDAASKKLDRLLFSGFFKLV
jgi:hypothetical protein